MRAQRRALQARISGLPVTDGDFAALDEQSMKQWSVVSQHLQELTHKSTPCRRSSTPSGACFATIRLA